VTVVEDTGVFVLLIADNGRGITEANEAASCPSAFWECGSART